MSVEKFSARPLENSFRQISKPKICRTGVERKRQLALAGKYCPSKSQSNLRFSSWGRSSKFGTEVLLYKLNKKFLTVRENGRKRTFLNMSENGHCFTAEKLIVFVNGHFWSRDQLFCSTDKGHFIFEYIHFWIFFQCLNDTRQ